MKHPISAVFCMPIFLPTAVCNQDIMKSINRLHSILLLFLSCLLCCALCGCQSDPILPNGGYDYRTVSAGDAFLGYPIPRIGQNPYCYDLPLQGVSPSAFSYDADRAEYLPLKTALCTLSLPNATLSVPCAVTEDKKTFFEAHAHAENITVYEGDIDGMAVVLSHDDGILYLADETQARPIAEHVRSVPDVSTEDAGLLFTDENGALHEYRGGRITRIADGAVHDAWYISGDEHHTVVFSQSTDDQPHAVRYYAEDGHAPVPCVIPQKASDTDSAVYIRGTAFLLQGNDGSAYFYDLRTGERAETDMGGLYRFPKDTETAALTLSPDGRYVYLYDIDYIYRLDLTTGALLQADNEAPIFEGDCILSSMTAVTDDTVILSQGSNEYTEFVPTITVAVFAKDTPDIRHEDEKIDLD